MKRTILFLLFSAILTACSESFVQPDPETVTIDELVFGRFYGMCFGESCVEIYMVNHQELLEDTTDNYLFQNIFQEGQFLRLENSDFDIAKNLLEEVPVQLTQGSNLVYGCPDCADQGGLHLKIFEGDQVRNFRFDLQNNENPEYLRDYLQRVNAVVDELAN